MNFGELLFAQCAVLILGLELLRNNLKLYERRYRLGCALLYLTVLDGDSSTPEYSSQLRTVT